ncbi:5-formyltetrahydrofolate cyclo-ligase [Radiomyces spectabilis]|uniref:5-formyltetrahydrofolate cyclo-ligase n=1 Tax=Radiomyces spectabilis TaxID=64574 RepID=UPI00222031BA|nr:5-formyltetrahydrofolate cyclo-ligase [Radiomyces spectabilis]KAI8369386.1 5-formyltetrahydrofolate cyclo-ligase [Radiomyces spectabilis]
MTTSMSSTLSLKRTFRKAMNAKLLALPETTIKHESERIFQRLSQLEIYKKSKNISVYISMPKGEVDTSAIIRDILASEGKTCYIPRCTKTTMDMVKISSWEDYTSLPRNKWDIPEPPMSEERENALEKDGLDLILVPGIAFDDERNRIGHGKGYYDRYLQKCRKWNAEHMKEPPKTIALALEAQITKIGEIPTETTDQKIDYVLTCSKLVGE